MPAKRRPSDNPAMRKRELILALVEYESAQHQNAADRRAGRIPRIGNGAVQVLAKRVTEARAAVLEIRESEPA